MPQAWQPIGIILSVIDEDDEYFFKKHINYLSKFVTPNFATGLLIEAVTTWMVQGNLSDHEFHSMACGRDIGNNDGLSAGASYAERRCWEYLSLMANGKLETARLLLEKIATEQHNLHVWFADLMRSLHIAKIETSLKQHLITGYMMEQSPSFYKFIERCILADTFSDPYMIGANLYKGIAGYRFEFGMKRDLPLYIMYGVALAVVEAVAVTRKIKATEPVDKLQLKSSITEVVVIWQILKGMCFMAAQAPNGWRAMVYIENSGEMGLAICRALNEGYYLLRDWSSIRPHELSRESGSLSGEIARRDTRELSAFLRHQTILSMQNG